MTDTGDPTIDEQSDDHSDAVEDDASAPATSRRSVLSAGALLGVLGLGSAFAAGRSTVAAQSSSAEGQVGTASRPIEALYARTLRGGSGSDLRLGSRLDTDGNGIESPGALGLYAGGSRALRLGPPRTVGGGDTAGGNVVAGHPDNAVNSGAVGVVIGGGGSSGGSENTVGGDYASVGGGSDNTANSGRATVGGGGGNEASGSYATVAGGVINMASDDATTVGGGENNEATDYAATIAGGVGNTASGFRTTVGGGDSNEAVDSYTTVGGGYRNTASAWSATIVGGETNTASGSDATVGGGFGNEASGYAATVGGGDFNEASGRQATVPGGQSNTASGNYSFAAGKMADTNVHDGAVVFGDSTSTIVTADNADEVRFQHEQLFVGEGNLPSGSGTALMYTSSGEVVQDSSSARYKTNIEPLSPEPGAVLELEPREFEYEERGERGVGLIAEEVDDHLPDLVNTDAKGRPDSVNYDRLGVYLVPEVRRHRDEIATLDAELDRRDERIDQQADRIERLEAALDRKDEEIDDRADRIEALEAENESLRDRNADLEDRIERLEAAVGLDDAPAADTTVTADD